MGSCGQVGRWRPGLVQMAVTQEPTVWGVRCRQQLQVMEGAGGCEGCGPATSDQGSELDHMGTQKEGSPV